MSDRLKILYEDNHLIAVFKPSGILIQSDGSGEKTLMDTVKNFLKTRDLKPGQVFLGLIHRLDKNVSGIVLFAKTSKGASRLSEQFREHSVIKKYTAIVSGDLAATQCSEGKAELWMAKDEDERKAVVKAIQPTNDSNFKRASLRYYCRKSEPNCTWVDVWLETGRFHQIRATMAFLGCPILGDTKYGGKIETYNETVFDSSHIALCADELSFVTATDSKPVTIQVTPFSA